MGMNTNGHFEPEITAFTCIYCAYMAADTAGALRQQYPANVKLVRLPCTGKTDVRYILEAFEKGVGLVKYCNQKLDEVEKKVELLVKDKEGKLQLKAFDEPSNDSDD